MTTNTLTLKLKRSNDRKVANLVTKNGKQAAIANTFGLPAGKAFSCPGATSVCESVCYAGKLEKLFKGVKANLLHNWSLLKDADQDTMQALLTDMINDFRADCVKKEAKRIMSDIRDGYDTRWFPAGTCYEAVSADCCNEELKSYCDNCYKVIGELQ